MGKKIRVKKIDKIKESYEDMMKCLLGSNIEKDAILKTLDKKEGQSMEEGQLRFGGFQMFLKNRFIMRLKV